MKPSELKQTLKDRIQAGIKRPVMVESSPGLGKTQIASQVAKELGIEFKAIHAPLLQPEDYGFPVINSDKSDVKFLVSKEKFPLEISPCNDSGILLIDELSQADGNAQKILANLIQEREIHGQKLKPSWTIIATGNKTTDRAGANRLLSHLRNRMTTLDLELSLDDWTQWALQNNVRPEVISFIRFRPELLSNFDPTQEINATPRAWAQGVSESLAIVSPETEFQLLSGDIGKGPASEFLGFLKICRKLPSIDTILLNPAKTEVPKDPATIYALAGALCHKTSEANFSRVMQYVSRMPAEFQVLFIRDTLAKLPSLSQTKEFISWASSSGKEILI